MTLKKEYVVLAVVILALSLYLVSRNRDRTHYQLPEISGVSGDDISKITISKPDASIELRRKGNKWEIGPEGYPADNVKVKGMLDVVSRFTLTTVVSESGEYDRYNLSEDKKITVKAWTGHTLGREFEVGKAAPSYRHTFVKLADDQRVYHARGNFRTKFDHTVNTLRDKTVLSFDQTAIQGINITKGQEVLLTLARKEDPVQANVGQGADAEKIPPPKVETIWETPDGRKGDEEQLEKLLATLSDLDCTEYIDNQDKKDFTDPIYVIQLKGAQEYTLSIFAKAEKDENKYPAISSQNGYPFFLPAWQADNVMKKPDEVLEQTGKP